MTILEAPGQPGMARCGLVIGKKVGNAVTRNRARRRLRHALVEVTLSPGSDYVVMADRDVVTVSFPTLVEWLRTILEDDSP